MSVFTPSHKSHRKAELTINFIAVVAPFLGLVAAIVLLWGVAFNWGLLAIMFCMYVATGLGITVGYHRYFTHKSFEVGTGTKAFLGILGSMALEGPVIKWSAIHRKHHQHSDEDGDPHSPHTYEGEGVWAIIRGVWRSHIGWIFEPDPIDLARYVPDLEADPVVRFVHKTFMIWVALGLLIPAAIAGAITQTWTGALLGLLWGGLVRIFVVHHITWSINSVCHLWGARPYESHDHSRNNPIFGVLGLGEGWHNNHHAFPASARLGLKWWQFDAGYIMLKCMMMLGLAKNVRIPSEERMASRVKAPAGTVEVEPKPSPLQVPVPVPVETP